jgi:hypothetical protein
MNLSALLDPPRLYAGVKRRLVQRRLMLQAIRHGKRFIGTDPNFCPEVVPSFFTPRPSKWDDDRPVLERIIRAYQKAKVDQKKADEAFNVSNEWRPIYERNLGPVMKALQSGDVPTLERMYQNFYRDPCSTGLVGLPINIPNIFSGGSIKQKFREYILCDVQHRYNLWKKRTGGKYTPTALSAPIVGNPYGYTVDGIFIRGGADYQHYYAHAIAELAKSPAGDIVVELGGGFGGLGFYLKRDNPQLTYVDFDLPEAVALASYYLIRSLPNASIGLYGEVELMETSLARPGIMLLPSFEILKMPIKSVAVSFNSDSLAEMSPATIRVYLDEISRITKGYFLHVNHNKNAVLSADEFGVEQRGFKLLNRELAGWTLGINPESDEYEYLYEREIDMNLAN